MENIPLLQENLNVIGAFCIGITGGVIIPIIKTIFAEWRASAPARKAKRAERRAERLAKKKNRQLNR